MRITSPAIKESRRVAISPVTSARTSSIVRTVPVANSITVAMAANEIIIAATSIRMRISFVIACSRDRLTSQAGCISWAGGGITKGTKRNERHEERQEETKGTKRDERHEADKPRRFEDDHRDRPCAQ